MKRVCWENFTEAKAEEEELKEGDSCDHTEGDKEREAFTRRQVKDMLGFTQRPEEIKREREKEGSRVGKERKEGKDDLSFFSFGE